MLKKPFPKRVMKQVSQSPCITREIPCQYKKVDDYDVSKVAGDNPSMKEAVARNQEKFKDLMMDELTSEYKAFGYFSYITNTIDYTKVDIKNC